MKLPVIIYIYYNILVISKWILYWKDDNLGGPE